MRPADVRWEPKPSRPPPKNDSKKSLKPLGPPLPLGASATPTSIRGAGAGTVAWFVWQSSPSDDVLHVPPIEAGGASIDLATPSVPATSLSGVLRPQMRGAIKIATKGSALLAAWPTDGGIGFSEWASPGATAPSPTMWPSPS